MDLILKRFHLTKVGTTGMVLRDGQPWFYTIERPWLDNAKGKSCIPVGKYKLELRKEQTPLTDRYRKRFDWFTWHIQLMDVPNRTGIYFHPANFPTDVEGCIGPGLRATLNNTVHESVNAYKPFYLKTCAAIEREPCTVTIERLL